MVHHCKSPRSRINLMVIDPLTPTLGHQFDCRVKIFSVSCATCSPPLIDSFHIVSAHAQNCLVPRYLREITREGSTCLYGCLTLHYGIWKTIKRNINSQVKIRQIVKLNDINVTKISD